MDCTSCLIFFYIFHISICDHFQQVTLDYEYIHTDSTIILPCHVNGTVQSCKWIKNGIPMDMVPGRYEMHDDPGTGACSLYIHHPTIGDDTTFFNCYPRVGFTDSLISLPYRILARKGESVFHRPPYSVSFTVSKSDSPIKKKVSVSGVVGSLARVRWFVNGIRKSAVVKNVQKSGQKPGIESSVEVTSKTEPVMVHYCIEINKGTIYKEIFIGVVYVIGDTYEISKFPDEPLIRALPFKITPPKLRMFWYYKGKQTMVNDNRIILKVNDLKELEDIRVECVDIASTSSFYLSWGLIDPNGNADVQDEGSEFSLSEKDGEKISATVKFLHIGHPIHMQCQAKNILHGGIEREVSVVIVVREQDACFVQKSSSKRLQFMLSSTTMSIIYLIFIRMI